MYLPKIKLKLVNVAIEPLDKQALEITAFVAKTLNLLILEIIDQHRNITYVLLFSFINGLQYRIIILHIKQYNINMLCSSQHSF